MENHDPSQGNPTSTHCRFCGSVTQCDEVGPTIGVEAETPMEIPPEREHYQVLVACGSCGHAFAAFSRN